MIRIETNIFRALMAVSPKEDIRYYLNGIYIDVEAGKVIATDGSRILTAEYEVPEDAEPLTESVILTIPARKPSASILHVDIEKVGDIYICHYRSARKPEQHVLSLIDGKYPDYARIVVDANTYPEPCISVNPEFLYDVMKALSTEKYCRATLRIKDATSQVVVDNVPAGVTYSVAPLRL